MKVDEMRNLGVEELSERLAEASEESFNLRFQNATGQLENYKRLGQLRRDIARIRTLIRERELGIEHEGPVEEDTPRRKRKAEAAPVEDEVSEADETDEDETDETEEEGDK